MTKEELYNLARDREQDTFELYKPNDFYGNATILKLYAGYAEDYQIKAAIEHGAYLGNYFWSTDIESAFPSLLIASANRSKILRSATNKMIFSIGPLIHYVESNLTDQEKNKEKTKLGRNLLVFPAHSTHWIISDYNIDEFISVINQQAGEFDSIRICLYWKDILDGKAEAYLNQGFDCVTAGHIYDKNFLQRLRNLYETADIVASNEFGSPIIFSILLGKPAFLINQQIYHSSSRKDLMAERNQQQTRTYEDKLKPYFSEYSDKITAEQQEIARKYFGQDEKKSPDEIRRIIDISEEVYQKGKEYFLTTEDILANEIADKINTGQYEEAKYLIKWAKKLNYGSGAEYAEAFTYLKTNDKHYAINLLHKIADKHLNANRLLNEINNTDKAW